ncbi:hypothetical protein Mapa_011524 [Marchantia paleacea]|nr:hypothetical protein Mapa_011524 [Marchantia paleacea]
MGLTNGKIHMWSFKKSTLISYNVLTNQNLCVCTSSLQATHHSHGWLEAFTSIS